MSNGKMVRLRKIEPRDPEDKRSPTYEWKHNDGRQITVIIRKKGSSIGGHYHKGEDPDKNPEKLFIAQGKMRAVFVDKLGRRVYKTLEEGDYFEIPAGIAHAMEILEDLVLLEYRVSHYNKDNPDTYPVQWIFNFLK